MVPAAWAGKKSEGGWEETAGLEAGEEGRARMGWLFWETFAG